MLLLLCQHAQKVICHKEREFTQFEFESVEFLTCLSLMGVIP